MGNVNAVGAASLGRVSQKTLSKRNHTNDERISVALRGYLKVVGPEKPLQVVQQIGLVIDAAVRVSNWRKHQGKVGQAETHDSI